MVILGDRYKFSQNEINFLKKSLENLYRLDISLETK